MNIIARTTLSLCILVAASSASADRFTSIVEQGGEPTVAAGGYLVNQKRVAVQRELAQRPPTADDLGVVLPPGARLQLEQTARQIAQYHPAWRVYEYRVDMPRADFMDHFQRQGLTFDRSANKLRFAEPGGDFIDGLTVDTMREFRVWRRPR